MRNEKEDSQTFLFFIHYVLSVILISLGGIYIYCEVTFNKKYIVMLSYMQYIAYMSFFS